MNARRVEPHELALWPNCNTKGGHMLLIIIGIVAFPPLLMVGLLVAEEIEWQRLKKQTGIK